MRKSEETIKGKECLFDNAKCCKLHLLFFLLLGTTGGGCLGFWPSGGSFSWFSRPREDAAIKQSGVKFLLNLFCTITIRIFGESFMVYYNFPFQ